MLPRIWTRYMSVTLLAALLCVTGAKAQSRCPALSEGSRAKLSSFVQRQYRIPAATPLGIADLGFMGDSCYRKLDFHSEDASKPLHITLFASPDLRFLSPDLMDSLIAPPAEVRKPLKDVTAALTKGSAATMGPKDAPVTMTLFSDFQCPYCAQMARGLVKDILPSLEGKVRVQFRHFPLPMHAWARTAAQAAACAREQGDEYFWKFHDYFFEHQRELSQENISKTVAEFAGGLPSFQAANLKTCLEGNATSAAIDQDVALGKEIGVGGTPTVFIGGERVVGYRPDEIRELVRQAGAPKGKEGTKEQ